MQIYLLCAAVLLIVIGVVHSVLGEILIFRHLRTHGLVPTMSAPPLKQRNVRIIWASWHALSVLGWAFAAVLLRLAIPSNEQTIQLFIVNAIIYSCLGSSFLVLIGTKGKHPGWIGLLGVAVLTWLS